MTKVHDKIEDVVAAPAKGSLTTIKFGQISFTNALPVVMPLTTDSTQATAEWVFLNPNQLNIMLAEGKLDLSAMSSFYYLQSREFKLFDRLSISSRGEVGSVLFYSKVPLTDLNGAKIEVTSSSATSVRLLDVLLREQFGVAAKLVVCETPSMNEDSSGALIIGDEALKKDEAWSSRYNRIDLGRWWHDLFGLPMVFGLWGARNSWVEQHESAFVHLNLALSQAREIGLTEMLEEVVIEAAARTGLTADRLKRYYTQELDFEFTGEHERGLRLYEGLCQKHGLLA